MILTPRRKAAKDFTFQSAVLSYLCALAPLREFFPTSFKNPARIFDTFKSQGSSQTPSGEQETVRSRTDKRLRFQTGPASFAIFDTFDPLSNTESQRMILTPRRKAAKGFTFQSAVLSYLCALAPLREFIPTSFKDPARIFDTFDIFNPWQKPPTPELQRQRRQRGTLFSRVDFARSPESLQIARASNPLPNRQVQLADFGKTAFLQRLKNLLDVLCAPELVQNLSSTGHCWTMPNCRL